MDSKTEKQARVLRCCGPVGCGALVPDPTQPLRDGLNVVHDVRMCIASECMAWRTTGFRRGDATHYTCATAVNAAMQADTHVEVVGVCGLACVPTRPKDPTTMVPFVPPTKPPRRPWWMIGRRRDRYVQDAIDFLLRRVDALERYVNRSDT